MGVGEIEQQEQAHDEHHGQLDEDEEAFGVEPWPQNVNSTLDGFDRKCAQLLSHFQLWRLSRPPQPTVYGGHQLPTRASVVNIVVVDGHIAANNVHQIDVDQLVDDVVLGWIALVDVQKVPSQNSQTQHRGHQVLIDARVHAHQLHRKVVSDPAGVSGHLRHQQQQRPNHKAIGDAETKLTKPTSQFRCLPQVKLMEQCQVIQSIEQTHREGRQRGLITLVVFGSIKKVWKKQIGLNYSDCGRGFHIIRIERGVQFRHRAIPKIDAVACVCHWPFAEKNTYRKMKLFFGKLINC